MSSLLLPSLSPRKKAPTDPARAPNRELLTTRPDLKGLRLYLHAHTHTQHAQCHACQACVTMQQPSLESRGQTKAVQVGYLRGTKLSGSQGLIGDRLSVCSADTKSECGEMKAPSARLLKRMQ